MAFRYWLSGPRLLGGLVRPDVSFYAGDLKRRREPSRPMSSKDVSLIGVFARTADGAVIFGSQKTMTPESLGESDKADGAHKRLARAAVDANGWLIGVSAGQVAAAIKSEAGGLSPPFDVIHRKLSPLAWAAIGIWAAVLTVGSLGCWRRRRRKSTCTGRVTVNSE